MQEFFVFSFGMFFIVFSFELVRFFVYEDIRCLFIFQFFDWVRDCSYYRYLDKKIDDVSASIDSLFDN